MKTINYVSKDNSLKIRLEFKRLRPYRYYKGVGKSWPITTQCLLFVNEAFIVCGEVIKHDIDTDNPKLGAMIACKKAMKKVNLRSVRKEIWADFHKTEWD